MVWITTDNVSAEAWRHLLEYANQELAIEAITRLHGEPKNKGTKQNYSKQAQQIRASILQAKEYFDAAENSSLITSPNHLYYGMVSLCSSIMLLLGNGEKALDKLRSDKKNNNHGLGFSTDVNAASCGVNFNILERSITSVRQDGFFLQWYSTLPNVSPCYALVVKQDSNASLTTRGRIGSETHVEPRKIVGTSASIMQLLKFLPDLNSSLINYGVTVPSSRADITITVPQVSTASESGETIQLINYEWLIHGTNSEEELQLILNQFVVPEDEKEKFSIQTSPSNRSCIVKLTHNNKLPLTYPSYRETINNEKIMYGERQLERHEIVDAYLSAYGLSMLSRYFPDIWVSCLESHCKAAKLIERLLFILIKKAPVMALAMMRSDDFVISTHRPTWH